MGHEDEQVRVEDVGQVHQGIIEGRRGRRLGILLLQELLVVQRGLVTVVAVGDEQGQVAQGLVRRPQDVGLRHPVEALPVAQDVFQGLHGGRRQGALEQRPMTRFSGSG